MEINEIKKYNENEVKKISLELIPVLKTMELNQIVNAYETCKCENYDKEVILRKVYKTYQGFGKDANEYLGLLLLYLIYNTSPYNNISIIIYGIIKKDLLYKNNKQKKVSWLELKYKIIYDYIQKYKLNHYEISIILFGIKMSFNFPGIIGNPMNEYKIKKDININDFIDVINSQNNTPFGSINNDYMISQMKGGLSIDLGYGCPLGCIYCYRIDDNEEAYINKWNPNFFITPEESINRLLNHPWFTPHVTPIGIHMSTTEAFLPSIWPYTYKLLSLLNALKLTNRVTIITKYYLEESQLELLNSLKYIDLDICVCYAGLPKEIEPSSNIKRLQFLKELTKYSNIKPIGYIRPLIEGYNTTEENIRNILIEYRKTGVQTLVYGGVKISDRHKLLFKNKLLDIVDGNSKVGHKYLGENSASKVKNIFKEVYGEKTSCKLFKHSSCARISARDGFIPDYNCHYKNDKDECLDCSRILICKAPKFVEEKEIKAIFERILKPNMKFELNKNVLYINQSLNRYEKIFIRQNLFVATGDMSIE